MKKCFATVFVFLCLIYNCFGQVDLEAIAKQEMYNYAQLHKKSQKRSSDGNVDVVFVRLMLEPNMQNGHIKQASAAFHFTTKANIATLDFDLRSELQVDSIIYHGAPVVFSHSNTDLITVNFPNAISNNTFDSLCIYYHGAPNMGTRAWFREVNLSGATVSTLSQPYGAPFWWPCRDNLIDKIDSLDVHLTVDTPYKAVSNGVRTSIESIGSKRKFNFKHRYPIANYLIAVTFSRYAEFTDKAFLSSVSKDLDIVNYVFPHNESSNTRAQAFRTVEIMHLFDSLFGPYPFHKEQYGHAQFAWGGGMEHQTMSFMVNFNYDLIAHELGHQWFGDKVTCGTWKDIWLNEGFATYSNLLCYDFLGTRKQWYDILKDVKEDVLSQAGGSVYAYDTADVNKLFDYRTTYQKGAMAMHQLRWLIGDDAFFKSVRLYLQDTAIAYDFARQATLQEHFETQSGMNLDDYFSDWIAGEGYPIYKIYWQQKGRTLNVNIKQTNSLSSSRIFNVPLPLFVKGKNKDSMIRVDINGLEENYSVNLDFVVTSLEFDPEHWLLAKSEILFDLNKNAFSLYPSPTTGDLFISSSDDVLYSVEIYDMLGRNVYEKKFSQGIDPGNIVTINLNSIAAGNYHVVIKGQNAQIHKLIVKL